VFAAPISYYARDRRESGHEIDAGNLTTELSLAQACGTGFANEPLSRAAEASG
jgi:hypothetical protein